MIREQCAVFLTHHATQTDGSRRFAALTFPAISTDSC